MSTLHNQRTWYLSNNHSNVQEEIEMAEVAPSLPQCTPLDLKRLNDAYEGRFAPTQNEMIPTQAEVDNCRRITGPVPIAIWLLCAVLLLERGSFYGIQNTLSNFLNRPIPIGGNGHGAPPPGQQTAGALGLGSVNGTAISNTFNFLSYLLPLVTGWLGDTWVGRFKIICWGIAVAGFAHILFCISGFLVSEHSALIPSMVSLLFLAIGTAMVKPNISVLIPDQLQRQSIPRTKVLQSGEKVIIDPSATKQKVWLWFYMLINAGALAAISTTYAEKLRGWWLAFLIPLGIWIPGPFILWFVHDHVLLFPPSGSELVNIFRVLAMCVKGGGIRRVGSGVFWTSAKPSLIMQKGEKLPPWDDQFVEDVRRFLKAIGIFCLIPIGSLSGKGVGVSANIVTTMLKSDGVPNDIVENADSLSILIVTPILGVWLLPILRKRGVNFGPFAQLSCGFLLSAMAGCAFTMIAWYAYLSGPCGYYSTSLSCINADKLHLTPTVSLWWMVIPHSLGGVSELFTQIPCYEIAYSHSPPGMRGVLQALFHLSQGISFAIGLALSPFVKDPYLHWNFAIPAGLSLIVAITLILFVFLCRVDDSLGTYDPQAILGQEVYQVTQQAEAMNNRS